MWRIPALSRACALRRAASLFQRSSISMSSGVACSSQDLAPSSNFEPLFPVSNPTEGESQRTASISRRAEEEVIIAMGSNVGNRVHNFNRALELLREAGIRVTSHASLYESAPAYVTNQPPFLNSAVKASTRLDPHSLLRTLKNIEADLGRTEGGIRYGPRPLDLDIIFYGSLILKTDSLQIPHPRLAERPFVLAPLVELMGPEAAETSPFQLRMHPFAKGKILKTWVDTFGGESCVGKEGLRRVLPFGERLWDWGQKTYVMGILNVTPDSFSDGGSYMKVDNAVAQVRKMVAEGAHFIDIGAQSTRPKARRLTTAEERERLLPVLDAIAVAPDLEGVCLSVDTFDSKVAKDAVARGVHLVNDVSGGSLDPEMWKTVAQLGVPYVSMHMRGDPLTMQNETHTQYSNLCSEVAAELASNVNQAELAGIPSWRMIIDPGIGFAKTSEQNVNLMRELSTFREEVSLRSKAAANRPMLFGPSRKGFLGKLCGHAEGKDRDFATVAAVVVGVAGGADIIRAHNVRAAQDAVMVADAVYRVSHRETLNMLQ